MAIEIERKFLVKTEAWRDGATGKQYCQGYLCRGDRTVRVRIAGDQAWLTIKGASTGISRLEYEYPIPLPDAEALLTQLCDRPLIQKIRYTLPYAGLTWEIDEFLGDNHGLILAEVELDTPDQPISLPDWVGQDVSEDPRYYNAYLVDHPYSQWDEFQPPQLTS